MQVPQCGTHIADGVQHVGPNDEVECRRVESLFHAWFFEIENLKLHLRKRRQLLRGAGKKCGRDIAVYVGMQAALQEW